MSEHEIQIKLADCLEAMLQRLERIEKMLWQLSMPRREFFNSKEVAHYMGLSVRAVYRLCKKNHLPFSKARNGKLYFNQKTIYRWMMTQVMEEKTARTTEEQKLAILQLQSN